MLALQLPGWRSKPTLVDVERPEPGPGEALIRVGGAGLCHSDLHMMEWPDGTAPFGFPFTLGHETAGIVAALGPGARGVAEGDPVLVHSLWGCGHCWHCRQGAENRCQAPLSIRRGFGAGVGFDGGLAEYMLVRSTRHLVPIGDLDPVAAAPLADAALTPYHAIALSAHQLRPSTAAVVIGVGGVGHMAVQLLRALSPVRIVAVDLRDEALTLARDAGADVTIPARGLTPEALRAEVGAAGAALVLDCVAADATLELAAAAVGVGGDLCYLGRGGGSLAVAPVRIPFETTVRLPSWGTLPELVEIVALARAGAIRTEVEPIRLADVLAGYDRLRRGDVRGRLVAVPGTATPTSIDASSGGRRGVGKRGTTTTPPALDSS